MCVPRTGTPRNLSGKGPGFSYFRFLRSLPALRPRFQRRVAHPPRIYSRPVSRVSSLTTGYETSGEEENFVSDRAFGKCPTFNRIRDDIATCENIDSSRVRFSIGRVSSLTLITFPRMSTYTRATICTRVCIRIRNRVIFYVIEAKTNRWRAGNFQATFFARIRLRFRPRSLLLFPE